MYKRKAGPGYQETMVLILSCTRESFTKKIVRCKHFSWITYFTVLDQISLDTLLLLRDRLSIDV